MARHGSAASGFSEMVETAGATGTCIKQTTATGETYVVNVATGEKVIPGSLRPDGTMRRPIKVRPGYTPVEERRAFRTRQQLSREEHRANAGSSIPGLTLVEEPASKAGINSKLRAKKQGRDTHSARPQAEQPPNRSAAGVEDKLCGQVEKLSIRENGEQPKAVDPSKRLRNIRKKINEIVELEKKVAAGETPTPEQLEKIGRKATLLAEAAELEKSAKPSE